MMQIKAKFDTDEGLNFIQLYYINQGLKKFGDDGKDAVDKELRQMLLGDCFTPKFVKDMTASERKKAQSAMMLLADTEAMELVNGYRKRTLQARLLCKKESPLLVLLMHTKVEI
ncbi:unnamed protein product [Cylindrotheca closterium]|uniref:Uncharacterized protein n=1 Tax=Cylindrotheca closterium TaxID=2856 RepID=A0AAD2FSL2_9STRA|nr:unnamed protein product [Cylindrotheca closterium]